MADEQAFLLALQDNPNDLATRLVYADWLEESGDIRAEYLRIEAELQHLGPRFEQLMKDIDPAWISAVSRRVTIVLVAVSGTRMINAIKAVRQVTGCGLKDAKDLVEAVAAGKPHVLRRDATPDDVLRIRAAFFDCAGELRVDPWTANAAP